MPAEQSGAGPSIPIFSAHAEAKAAEALNVLIFAHGGGEERIREEQLATLRWSLTGLVDCLFPINGDYADFGGVDSLDGIDYVHPTRVAALAIVIGRMSGMRRSELISLAMAAALMNVGYLALRRSLLDQPRRLLEGEWEEHVHTHPARGTALLAQAGLSGDSLRAIEQHHERWDGSGYPAGLSGDAISRHARILAVADTYVSLRSVRPHRPPVEAEPALEEIAAGRDKLFDPDVVDAFEDVLARFSGIMRPSRAGSVAASAAAAAGEDHSVAQRDGADAIDTAAEAATDPASAAGDEVEQLPPAVPGARRRPPTRRQELDTASHTVSSPSRIEALDTAHATPSPRSRRAEQPAAVSNAAVSRRSRSRRAASRHRRVHHGLFATTLYVDAALCGSWPVDRPPR